MASTVLYTQVRTRTVNFFARRSGTELMKAATGFSKYGIMKGQGRGGQKPIRGANRLYYIGASPLKIQYAGLNRPIYDKNTRRIKDPMLVTRQSESEIKDNLLAIRSYFANRPKQGKKRESLNWRLGMNSQHVLDRGFVGYKMEGVMLGPPPFFGNSFQDFQCTVLKVRRVCHMITTGRKFKIQALVFIGNGQGIGGYAVGQAAINKPFIAIMDGFKKACRRLFYIERLNDHTDFYAECNYSRMFVQRQYPGYGITCHPRLEVICRLLGIKDIYIKVDGGKRNYLAMCHAFVTGLLNQETHRDLAERSGMHVVKLDHARNYYPEIVCSPINTPMRKEADLSLQEKLRLDDFYGEGRYPYKKYDKWAQIRYRQKPFRDMYTTPMEYRRWPFRNMEKVMIRLLADESLPRWTREARRMIGEVQHQEAMIGLKPIPRGIGLGSPRLPTEKPVKED